MPIAFVRQLIQVPVSYSQLPYHARWTSEPWTVTLTHRCLVLGDSILDMLCIGHITDGSLDCRMANLPAAAPTGLTPAPSQYASTGFQGFGDECGYLRAQRRSKSSVNGDSSLPAASNRDFADKLLKYHGNSVSERRIFEARSAESRQDLHAR